MPGGVDLVVSPAEAAARLRISQTRVFDLLARGELKSFRDGKRRLILVQSLEEWVTRQAVDAGG